MSISPVAFSNAYNLNNVSFGARDNNYNRTRNNNSGRPRTNNNRAHNNNGDSYEFSRRQQPVKRKKQGLTLFQKGALTAALVGAIGLGAHSCSNSTSNVVKITNTPETSISYLAETYGIDEDIIMDYNGLAEGDAISEKEEIKIPSYYDYLDEKIQDLNETLHKKHLSEEKRAEAEEKINALKQKQADQKEVADVYRDDTYIYFSLHLKKDDDDIYSSSSISAEKFKKLFDIEDGALRGSNNLEFTWGTDGTADYVGHFRDYTNSRLHDGQTYKVPAKSIKTNNINLDDYLKH